LQVRIKLHKKRGWLKRHNLRLWACWRATLSLSCFD